MASRKQKKPRIPRARKSRPAPVTEKTLGESIIEQMQTCNSYLAIIAKAMQDRNGMLSVVTSETAKQTVAYQKVAATITEAPPASTTLEQAAEGEPVKRKRGRPSKAELAARAAAAAPAEGNDVKAMVQDQETARENFPQMCACGVREDLPPHLHAKGCPVHHKQEPVPQRRASTTSEPMPPPPAAQATEAVPAPTLDDVRAVAITFVGKHGKDKLGEMLKQHGADKLSSLPAEKLPALLAALQKEV